MKVPYLEGPHRKHHDHGPNASVPHPGLGQAVPAQNWERHYSMVPYNGPLPAGAFNPKRSKDRPCTHNKVNDTDN